MTYKTNTLARSVGSAALGLAVLAGVGGDAASPKFFADDPIVAVVDSQDASGVSRWDIDLTVDTLENLVSWPGDRTPNVRAQNVNTIDEVPDSSWFTNRLGGGSMTVDELLKGRDTTNGPAPGPWTVVAAKNDGVTPGFTVRDEDGVIWFVKVDPPGYRSMATGTEMVVAKLMWALGYHVPEVHLATLRADQLLIGDPDRCLQCMAPTAVNRRGRYFLREVLDELKSGVRFSIASDGGIALHGVSLLVDAHAVLFHRARIAPASAALFSDDKGLAPYEDAYPQDLFVKRAQP